MKAVQQDLIKLRAYEIWEQSGRPLGLDKEHWEQAERELLEAAPPIKAKAAVVSATKKRPGQATSDDRIVAAKPRQPAARGESARVR
jgi:hypothetical protein